MLVYDHTLVAASDLLIPGKKPIGPVKIARNSLTEGITHYLLFQGNAVVDLVTGKFATKNGDAHWEPAGFAFDESGDYLALSNVTLNSKFSILTNISPYDNTGSIYQYFVSFGSFAAANSINWYISETSEGTDPNTIKAYLGNGGGYNLFTFYPTHVGKDIALTVNSTTMAQYVNGVSVGSTTGTPGAMANGTTDTLYIGGRSDLNADRFFGGTMKYFIIYGNRALTLPEVNAIHSDIFGSTLEAP